MSQIKPDGSFIKTIQLEPLQSTSGLITPLQVLTPVLTPTPTPQVASGSKPQIVFESKPVKKNPVKSLVSHSQKEHVDVNFYTKAYRDIKSVDVLTHYETHGRQEDRLPSSTKFYTLYPEFDINLYKSYNRDIIHLNNDELLCHFHHHGRFEGRLYKKSPSIESSPLPPTILLEPLINLSKRSYVEETSLQTIVCNNMKCPIDPKLMNLLKNKPENKPVYLVMAEWGFPPYGGGECWLIDTMKWLSAENYACYYIYFCDSVKKTGFDKIEIIASPHGDFIRFTNDYIQLLQFLLELNPKIISHQGNHRQKYINIAKFLKKPIITGFCFWGDIVKFSPTVVSKVKSKVTLANLGDVSNYNMINKKLVADESFDYIYKNCAYSYACGKYVNDIVKKVHNVDIDVINTISDESHYKCDYRVSDLSTAIYVTVVNITGLKGGYILENLINQTNIQIPFYLIDSQETGSDVSQQLERVINERNRRETGHKSVFIKGAISDIKSVYKKTRILLVTSLVDETFCRVGYESMMNGIPILSTKFGNLQYLLKNYADFLDPDPLIWSNEINKIYNNQQYLESMSSRSKSIDASINKTKFIEKIKQEYVLPSEMEISHQQQTQQQRVGIFCPWGDQGLGIQCREYYDMFVKLGHIVSIFSFKPYHANSSNPRLQTDSSEWDYPNIYYCKNKREEIQHSDFLDYLIKFRVEKMVIVETCFDKVFELAEICKLASIKVYAIPNLETVRSMEVARHRVFDKIICNNQMTYEIFNNFYPQTTSLFSFRILNKNYTNNKVWNKNHCSFFCCGGLNSVIRKNIDKIIQSFKEIEGQKRQKNFKLYVYIQGAQIPPQISRQASSNIIIKIGALTYAEIAKLYKTHDVFIHMGDHEGLGLGFYESIACGTPILTINTPPNNEIIKEDHNGWLVKCTHSPLNDNLVGIVKKAVITVGDLREKMINIINTYDRKTMYDLTTRDYIARYPIWHYNELFRKTFDL
jgi:glycosyltransferase involved in cell wall biosynthesis